MEETKKCPYCGEEILATAKKCKHCGQWLEKKCPNCGQWVNINAKKCKHCRTWIEEIPQSQATDEKTQPQKAIKNETSRQQKTIKTEISEPPKTPVMTDINNTTDASEKVCFKARSKALLIKFNAVEEFKYENGIIAIEFQNGKTFTSPVNEIEYEFVSNSSDNEFINIKCQDDSKCTISIDYSVLSLEEWNLIKQIVAQGKEKKQSKIMSCFLTAMAIIGFIAACVKVGFLIYKEFFK